MSSGRPEVPTRCGTRTHVRPQAKPVAGRFVAAGSWADAASRVAAAREVSIGPLIGLCGRPIAGPAAMGAELDDVRRDEEGDHTHNTPSSLVSRFLGAPLRRHLAAAVWQVARHGPTIGFVIVGGSEPASGLASRRSSVLAGARRRLATVTSAGGVA